MSKTKHQKFEAREVQRSEIKNAPYNPRKISDYQFKGLKSNLKKVGLLQPLVWNERTGNLVSGHQRLKALDQLEKTDDYMITVAVVDLDEKTEKEQNIFFNSTTFQGEFDFDMLRDILQDIDPLSAGLDEYDLNIIQVDEEEKTGTGNEDEDDFFDKAAKRDKIKSEKKRASGAIESRFDEGEKYITLSFDDYHAKAEFCRFIGVGVDDLYVKGELVAQKIDDHGLQK